MVDHEICQRCRKDPATVVSRKEKFCNSCFHRFVSQKQRKQMMLDPYYQDIFKVMYQDKVRSAVEADLQNSNSNILLPLSFGSSSLVMLDVLNDTLTEQKETQRGKTGFQIDVVACYNGQEEMKSWKRSIKELWEERYKNNREKLKFHLIDLNSFFITCGDSLSNLFLDNKELSALKMNNALNICSIKELLDQCSDRSAREDFLTLVKRHLIKKFAYQKKHKAILWGHSMTKLADETISLIVKGRGDQIACLLDSSKFDDNYDCCFKNLYPLRDILLSEVDAYCYISGLTKYLHNYQVQDTLLLHKFIDRTNSIQATLTKNMTINEMARKYFDDIEGDYSNVISTVVRTADKLAEPPVLGVDNNDTNKCVLCSSNIHSDGSKWLKDITINDGHPGDNEEEFAIFNKWKGSSVAHEVEEYNNLRDRFYAHGNKVSICYGCIIIMNRTKRNKISWPQKSKTELNAILDDFVLTDDDDE